MARLFCVALLAGGLAICGKAPAQDFTPYPQPGAKPASTASKAAPVSEPVVVAPQPATSVEAKAVPANVPVPEAAAVPTVPVRPAAISNTVVELPAQPMLDAEGKQRLDTDGKPMFYAPVRQQRDKKGHPLFDKDGKPVMQTAKDLGYDEHGKKLHEEKEKKVKVTPLAIERGVLTVDGLTGKAALNYDIADLKYIYIYAPGIGVTLISNAPFPGATEQSKAFEDKTLTVSVDGHILQLASDKRLLGKKPEVAYVRLDRQFMLPSKFPVMGYGPTAKAPYMWPGAKPNTKLAGVVEAPPVPTALLPTQLLKPCPTGQMRKASKPALPGEPVVVMPCEPIVAVVGKSRG